MASHAKKKTELTVDLVPFAVIGKRLGIPEKITAQIYRRAMKKIQKVLTTDARYAYIQEWRTDD